MGINLLGRGVAYPLRRSSTGGVQMAEGYDLVEMSLQQIIETDPMERPFDVRQGVPFGTRVTRMLFEPTPAIRDIARYDIKRAVRVWEPRVNVLSVDVPDNVPPMDPRDVQIVVKYEIRATNRQDNLVVTLRRP